MIGKLYTNLGNGSVIEVVEAIDQHTVYVVTQVDSNGEPTSQRRKRSVRIENLSDSEFKANGQRRTSGWIPYNTGNTQAVPASVKKENTVTAQINEPTTYDEVDLESMSTEALIQYGHQLDLQAKQAKDAVDLAKAELKKRAQRPGVTIVGESVFDLGRNMVFSETLATQKLTAQQLAAVSEVVTKIDSKKVESLLGKQSELYKSLLVPADNFTLKLRTVTEKDRLAELGGQLSDPFKKK